MKTISTPVEQGDVMYCPHCRKNRKVILEKDDPDNSEPNLVTCFVCLEVIAVIERDNDPEEDEEDEISIDNILKPSA